MKLTADQITEIKAFISKRGFTYPDVQLEIIDHVASRVEELMSNDHTLTLHQAISITHGEFGIMGFSVFEDSMISSLQKRFFKLFISIFSSYFHWKYLPAIAASVYLIDRFYVAINNPGYFVAGVFMALLITLVATGITYEVKYKKYNKMLTMRMGNSYVVICAVIYNLWNITLNQFKLYQKLSVSTAGLIFGVLIVLIILLFLVVDKLRKITISNCIELDEKYNLLSSL
ncbi:MAG: hypothetical protein ABIN91_07540 [Mucilaginibacter sp.]|uniref:hypothetical protein n=1 Tax=Mucilaginibacter sp. TaxID=1882438 RepID=UPI0032651045